MPANETDQERQVALEKATDRLQREVVVLKQTEKKLLNETRYRVKNNLQIITSLLSPQSETIQDEQLRIAFRGIQHRVHAMSLIYTHLYQFPNPEQIRMATYIENLLSDLFQLYGRNSISRKIDVAEVMLDIDLAIPCGLIIGELVSNSIRHAFPTRSNQTREIQIVLRLNGTNCELVVGDNGIGLPANLDPFAPESLGLRLVNLLIRQLKGSIELDRDRGTTYKLTFAASKL